MEKKSGVCDFWIPSGTGYWEQVASFAYSFVKDLYIISFRMK